MLGVASPGLKSTTAFMQANSVGSTAKALKRPRVSCSARTSRVAGSSFPGDGSGTARSGQLSRGMDHWMAQSRNSSLHASSSRITWGEREGTPKPLSPPKSPGRVATTAGWADEHLQGNPKKVVEMLQLPQLAAAFWGVPVAPQADPQFLVESASLTWSRKGRLEKTGRFLAHFTAMKRRRAEVS